MYICLYADIRTVHVRGKTDAKISEAEVVFRLLPHRLRPAPLPKKRPAREWA